MSIVKKLNEMTVGVQLSFFIVLMFGSRHGMMTPIFRVGLPSLAEPLDLYAHTLPGVCLLGVPKILSC